MAGWRLGCATLARRSYGCGCATSGSAKAASNCFRGTSASCIAREARSFGMPRSSSRAVLPDFAVSRVRRSPVSAIRFKILPSRCSARQRSVPPGLPPPAAPGKGHPTLLRRLLAASARPRGHWRACTRQDLVDRRHGRVERQPQRGHAASLAKCSEVAASASIAVTTGSPCRRSASAARSCAVPSTSAT